jgi:hypothetical protein
MSESSLQDYFLRTMFVNDLKRLKDKNSVYIAYRTDMRLFEMLEATGAIKIKYEIEPGFKQILIRRKVPHHRLAHLADLVLQIEAL